MSGKNVTWDNSESVTFSYKADEAECSKLESEGLESKPCWIHKGQRKNITVRAKDYVMDGVCRVSLQRITVAGVSWL